MAICKICGQQVVAGEVYHTDCIGAEMDRVCENGKALLTAAIEDIPHVGNFCAHMDEGGYCTLSGEICCRRVHTSCPNWKWRGLGE